MHEKYGRPEVRWDRWSPCGFLKRMDHGSIWTRSSNHISRTPSVFGATKRDTREGFVGFASEGIFYLDPNDSTWKTTPANLFEGKLPGSQGLYNSIRGSAGNNVFAAGDYGAVIHFNGRNWKCFTELISYPESRLLNGLCITNNRVFISGTSYGQRGILIVARGDDYGNNIITHSIPTIKKRHHENLLLRYLRHGSVYYLFDPPAEMIVTSS